MSGHLARHVLEESALGAAQQAHLASCARCTERRRALELARAEFSATHASSEFAARVMARAAAQPPAAARAWARLRVPATASALLAAAAALLLWVRVPQVPPRHEDTQAIRYKGTTASLEVFVKRGASTRPLRAGEALAAGDQLAFSYTLAEPQHLLLLGIDDAGTIHRYFPEPSLAPSSFLPAAGAHQLQVGIELDARRGQERLVALFSSAPLDEARARAALVSALREARTRGAGVDGLSELALPAKQVSTWFDKP